MRVLIVLMSFLISVNAEAFFNGNELYDMCPGNRVGLSMFAAGVVGKGDADIKDLYDLKVGLLEIEKKGSETAETTERLLTDLRLVMRPFCIPPKVTVRQIGDLTCKWLALNPEKRNYPGAALITLALADTWPCNPNRNRK